MFVITVRMWLSQTKTRTIWKTAKKIFSLFKLNCCFFSKCCSFFILFSHTSSCILLLCMYKILDFHVYFFNVFFLFFCVVSQLQNNHKMRSAKRGHSRLSSALFAREYLLTIYSIWAIWSHQLRTQGSLTITSNAYITNV